MKIEEICTEIERLAVEGLKFSSDYRSICENIQTDAEFEDFLNDLFSLRFTSDFKQNCYLSFNIPDKDTAWRIINQAAQSFSDLIMAADLNSQQTWGWCQFLLQESISNAKLEISESKKTLKQEVLAQGYSARDFQRGFHLDDSTWLVSHLQLMQEIQPLIAALIEPKMKSYLGKIITTLTYFHDVGDIDTEKLRKFLDLRIHGINSKRDVLAELPISLDVSTEMEKARFNNLAMIVIDKIQEFSEFDDTRALYDILYEAEEFLYEINIFISQQRVRAESANTSVESTLPESKLSLVEEEKQEYEYEVEEQKWADQDPVLQETDTPYASAFESPEVSDYDSESDSDSFYTCARVHEDFSCIEEKYRTSSDESMQADAARTDLSADASDEEYSIEEYTSYITYARRMSQEKEERKLSLIAHQKTSCFDVQDEEPPIQLSAGNLKILQQIFDLADRELEFSQIAQLFSKGLKELGGGVIYNNGSKRTLVLGNRNREKIHTLDRGEGKQTLKLHEIHGKDSKLMPAAYLIPIREALQKLNYTPERFARKAAHKFPVSA